MCVCVCVPADYYHHHQHHYASPVHSLITHTLTMSCTGAIPKRGARQANKDKDSTDVIGEPLDELYMNVPNQGGDWRVPALHKYWTQKGTYLKYVRPPPPVLPDGSPPPAGASESWIEQMELMEEDLRGLLRLPHHKFWSQMIYDPNVHLCLESYLSQCPRWYEEMQVDRLCKDMVASLHRLVLLIYLRLATPRESQTSHITPAVFAQMIYENFLIDACQLLDLSVVYGPSCGPLLTRMFACVFRHQPKYYQDLIHTVSSIALALEGVEDKLRVSDYEIPLPLDAVMENLSVPDLQTVVLFLLDTFSSLHLFLSLHPPAAKCFQDDVNELRIASFYERVVSAITSQLRELSQGLELNPRLVKEINLMRSSMLATFRALLHHKCLAPLQEEKSGTAAVGGCVERFLHIMTTCVGEKVFITDYCSAFPIDDDIKIFMDKEGDITSLTFVREAITTVLKEMGTSPRVGAFPLEHLGLSDSTKPSEDPMNTNDMNGYAQEGTAASTPDLDVAAGVSSVQELLPDLGAGFIRECLRYYNHRPEEVINALLEDNLPPSLANLDRSAPLRPSTPPPPAEEESQEVPSLGILEQRANVYDNDEFDLFTRKDVDRSKIHKGKKATTTRKLLYEKDEATIDKLKEIGRQYEERGGTSIYEDEFRYENEEEYRAWDYDDEYDDTYDDNETGDIDELGPEKVVKRRPGIIGAGRLNTHIDYRHSNNSEEEKSDGEAEEDSAKQQQQQQEESSSDGIQARWTKHQPGARPKQAPKTNTRGIQRVFTKSSSKPSKAHTPTPERETGAGEENGEHASTPPPPPRPAFQSFCENPEVTRQRAEQRRRDRDYNRGHRGRGGGDQGWRESRLTNGVENGGEGGPGRPRVGSTKHSGKGWRHGDGGDEDRGGYRGGKYKEDTNHGRAQSQQHRHKMVHKNEYKRQGAQAKFNRNN
ncbi:activating signal cointegrator 1 complex subunit 2-like isoform X1 [Scylla paramamosain]|uniref:activating signal cointegrator 1 complex subunit 2-like isoform X1 n=1 Tax=Scylla paramamosain TaxID=85552 RepID=UPI003082CD63